MDKKELEEIKETLLRIQKKLKELEEADQEGENIDDISLYKNIFM